jgi:hypothetical protein
VLKMGHAAYRRKLATSNFQRYKVCMNRSSDERVMAPGSRGTGAVFVCFSGEDSGQTGDATGEPNNLLSGEDQTVTKSSYG